jgi:pilus assembly protein CpaF
VSRLSDGSRRVKPISEIVGMEGDVITMQDIFTFEQTGVDETGRVQGRLRPTGIRPRCMERLQTHGFTMAMDAFSDAATGTRQALTA